MRALPIQFVLIAAVAVSLAPAAAQVPVDDSGNPIGADARLAGDVVYDSDTAQLSNSELEMLVDRVALYPDDLLAIVLPAATYPLQVVEASRFLDALEDDPSLEPDPDWDDSIVALINYPEIVELMNDDLEWTYALGEAFVMQQEDLLIAVDSFRDRAYAAGNLKSDDYQEVRESDDGIIEIEPVNDDVIYVPYYEPERVVVYQTRPVYHYYSRPYPVYYYPYADSWVHAGYFYGLTSAFHIGWSSHNLYVLHHSHRYHPYYGHYYGNNWWYRRPPIHVHNSIYVGDYGRRNYRYGDHWRPRYEHRIRLDGQRVTRNRYYGDRQRNSIRAQNEVRRDDVRHDGNRRNGDLGDQRRRTASREAGSSVSRNADRRLPVARDASGNRLNDSAARLSRDAERQRPRIASDGSRRERPAVERRQSPGDRESRTPAERRQEILNPDQRTREQRPAAQQRVSQTNQSRTERARETRRQEVMNPDRRIREQRAATQARASQTIQSRPERARESRPTQSRPVPVRQTQARPTQSRSLPSRPVQSQPRMQSRPVQSRPTQSRPVQSKPSRPATQSNMPARRTESRPAPRRSDTSGMQRSRSTRPDSAKGRRAN